MKLMLKIKPKYQRLMLFLVLMLIVPMTDDTSSTDITKRLTLRLVLPLLVLLVSEGADGRGRWEPCYYVALLHARFGGARRERD